ncbi:hypothetical protein Cni_G08389 [Canna indica]|uniref:TCP domain-containing protein n=1 Tax=Canna indica TaxID=4628 RepID=A0AAQ3K2T8_9LILI|nr:hypothetical protein Cni_G08389 [Canna indica]
MISRLREKESTPKHGGTTNTTISTNSSRPWLGLKNPRIVRVPRAFAGKDRHSKVSTIRGLRDRRVRLSVQTALQLYDLQDKLGFNQPSKVVDWLLSAAQHEIDKLPPLPFPPENFAHFCTQPAPLPINDEEKASRTAPSYSTINPTVAENNVAFSRNVLKSADDTGKCQLALFSSMANDEALRINKFSELSKFPNFTSSSKEQAAASEGNSIRFVDADHYGAQVSANASYHHLDSANLNSYDQQGNNSNSLSLMPRSQLVFYASGGGTPSMFSPYMSTALNSLHPMQMSHIQAATNLQDLRSDSVTFLQSSSSPIMVRPSHPRHSCRTQIILAK